MTHSPNPARQLANQQATGSVKLFAPADAGEYPARRVAESRRAGKEEAMARRRFQRGQLVRRVVRNSMGQIDRDRSVWLGRWREDEMRQGRPVRVRRSRVLGTLRELGNPKPISTFPQPRRRRISGNISNGATTSAWVAFSNGLTGGQGSRGIRPCPKAKPFGSSRLPELSRAARNGASRTLSYLQRCPPLQCGFSTMLA